MLPDSHFMTLALDVCRQGIQAGQSPFGACIVRSDRVVACAHNQVWVDTDITAHAEVCCIRQACRALNTVDLSGCVIYSSCEPCPMCLGAIYWSRIEKLYYGNSKEDAASIEFDDHFIYKELDLPLDKRKLKSERMLGEEALVAFKTWENNTEKTEY